MKISCSLALVSLLALGPLARADQSQFFQFAVCNLKDSQPIPLKVPSSIELYLSKWGDTNLTMPGMVVADYLVTPVQAGITKIRIARSADVTYQSRSVVATRTNVATQDSTFPPIAVASFRPSVHPTVVDVTLGEDTRSYTCVRTMAIND